MKKLSLKMKGIGEMLTREQMKNVLGGEGIEGGGCRNECGTDLPACPTGVCTSVACGGQQSFKMCI